MTSNIVPSLVKSYKGRAIRIRESDRYTCLTDMATASGKLFANWYQLKSTTSYLEALSPVIGIPITELIKVVQGGTPDEQGTWAHPKVAIKFAAWCSPQFEVQVTIWIDDLLTTGKVEIAPVAQVKPLLILQSEQVAQSIERIQSGLGRSNPRLAQILVDIGVNDFIESNQPKLATPQEFPEDKWYGLVQIANKIGITTNESTRGKLGTYISKLVKSGELDVERVREERLCNGQQQEIWCYRDTDVIRDAIKNWKEQ